MAPVHTKLKLLEAAFGVNKRVHENRVDTTGADTEEVVNHAEGGNRDGFPVVEQMLLFSQAFFPKGINLNTSL